MRTLEISEALSLIKVNELRKVRAIWYMGIPYIPHHVIVKEEDLYESLGNIRNIVTYKS